MLIDSEGFLKLQLGILWCYGLSKLRFRSPCIRSSQAINYKVVQNEKCFFSPSKNLVEISCDIEIIYLVSDIILKLLTIIFEVFISQNMTSESVVLN